VKVVEVSVAMAGPFCAMLLADHGADVVKVERVGAGDESRAWPPYFYGSMSHYFAAANRNKRSIAVDLKTADGRDVVKRLAANADVFVENYRVGALERAGLGYEDLATINPRLVYCSISGFGRHGPRREQSANDLFMQAFSGSMSITGEPGGSPVKMGPSVADIGAGLFATVGVVSALEARHRSGSGQHVNVSLLASQLAILSYHLTSYFATGVVPGPMGSGGEIGVPYQAFPTADDWIVVAVFNATMWESFCQAVARPEWIDDPRFASVDGRVEHKGILTGMIQEVLTTDTAAHWEAKLGAAGVPSTRVNRIDQVLADPQVAAESMLCELNLPGLGPIRTAAPPIDFSQTPATVKLPPPRLGEHTREVLKSIGLSDTDIASLAAKGAIGLDTGPTDHQALGSPSQAMSQ
jgi:crotonobetainyl-CoA:carnitine CoA-transferase CaiB-like acyl-CoA transferase